MTEISSNYLLNSPFLAKVDPIKGIIGPKYSQMLAEEMSAPIEKEQEKAARQGTQPAFTVQPNFIANLSPETQAELLAIQEAQSNVVPSEEAEPEKPDIVAEFLDYMSKTPEERYFEAILKELGLTPEEYAALPPEEKVKIELKVKDKMQQDMEDAAVRDEKTA